MKFLFQGEKKKKRKLLEIAGAAREHFAKYDFIQFYSVYKILWVS